jgi:hypothetical protein
MATLTLSAHPRYGYLPADIRRRIVFGRSVALRPDLHFAS